MSLNGSITFCFAPNVVDTFPFLVQKQWQQECLSLTLEEIVHIRSVLTKAELESLPVEGRVKEDAEKGKVSGIDWLLTADCESHMIAPSYHTLCVAQVCFLCMKTRFGFFGPRGQQCRLCNRTVCSKCHSKVSQEEIDVSLK